MSKRRCTDDPREKGIKNVSKMAGALYDSAIEALRCHRADPVEYSETTRADAVNLCLRRVDALARDIRDTIARLPR